MRQPTESVDSSPLGSSLTAALAEQQNAGPPSASRGGVAKITANTAGVYTITEQRRKVGDDGWQDAPSPLGHVGTTARDYRGRTNGQIGQLVRFWEQRRSGGELDLLIDAGQGSAQSPQIMLPTDFENEAAQSDLWLRSAQGAHDGVAVRLQTRTAYDDEGDETLYGFYRTFLFDSAGALVSISAETRIIVDAPVNCPSS